MVPTTLRLRPRQLFIVLPAYNEEERIGQLLDDIHEALCEAGLCYHVIVVNDGSSDGTKAIVEARALQMPITLQSHVRNEGLGVTIRDGIEAAASLADARDIVITMDADNTHVPGSIQRMTRMIWEGHDVIIASRYQPGSRTIGVPVLRRFLSYAASFFLRIVFPTSGVKDFTCGYRAYRAAVLQQAIELYGSDFLNQKGFECMVDILLKLRGMNVIFGEVPIILRYDRKQGFSKMKVTRTITNTLRLIVRRRFWNGFNKG
jgi:dolichol-phosphate mannosyltransferase